MKRIEGSMEVKKHAYRQVQDGVIISFTVHPSDVSPELAAAPLGTVFMVGYAEVVEGQEAPVEPPQSEEQPKERRPFHTLPLPQQAGILANDPRFQMWACGIMEEEPAATFIRNCCGVGSRSNIFAEDESGRRFRQMYEQYTIDTSLQADPH